MMPNTQTLPWYRHRWPWLLMAGPAIVALGCIVTIWLCFRYPDPSVARDYYKQGLVINKDIRRQHRATELHILAQLHITPEGLIEAQLQGLALPEELTLKFTHPTQSGHDRSITLYQVGSNHHYVSKTLWNPNAAPKTNWYLTLETPTWRLDTSWNMDAQKELSIHPEPQ